VGETRRRRRAHAARIDRALDRPRASRAFLADRERYLDRDWRPEGGETNPFLHLQMHLAIEEQLSIDQPPGIRAAVEALARKHGSMHDARHDVMDCLAESIWNAQRHGAAFDNASYLDCLERKRG
jgi:hypothetical protein